MLPTTPASGKLRVCLTDGFRIIEEQTVTVAEAATLIENQMDDWKWIVPRMTAEEHNKFPRGRWTI